MFFAVLPGARAQDNTVELTVLSQAPEETRPLNLPDKCHTQGIAFDDNYFYLSCVARKDKKAWVYRVPRTELGRDLGAVKFDKLEVTEGGQYHPSGLDINGECLWLAAAEYHPAPANSTFKCIDRETFREKTELAFKLDDHIGTVAAMEQWLVGMNWNAKTFYLMDYSGKLMAQGKNPGLASFQDCKHYREKLILCSGPSGKTASQGSLEIIEIAAPDPLSWKLKKCAIVDYPVGKFKSVAGEGMTWEGNDLYFVPEDLPRARLLRFNFPEFLE